MGVFLTDLVCGRLWAWYTSLVSVRHKPMLGSYGRELKRGGNNRKKTQVVILGSIHSCGPGAVVWLVAVKRLHLNYIIWVYLFFFSWPLPEPLLTPSFDLALDSANSKQLGSLVRFGRCTWLAIRPT